MARTTTRSAREPMAASTGRKQASKPGRPRPSPELRRLFKVLDTKDLFSLYALGEELLRIHPELPRGEKLPYGAKILETLAQDLSEEGPTKTLYIFGLARRLASRFKTRKELEKFRGTLNTWHVMSLLSVDEKNGNKSSMTELRDRCIEESWSALRLKREIQIDRGGKRGGGRRPRPMKVATAAIAVQDLIVAARRWTSYHDQCLAGRRPILKHARRAEYTAVLRRNVQEAIQGLERVQEAVEEELDELRPLAKKIKSALKG